MMRYLRFSIFCGFLALFVFPASAFARATFTLSTPSKVVTLGDSVTISIGVNSQSQAMNAVSGTINVQGGLSLTGVNKGGSIIDFWTAEPRIIGAQSRFEGVVLSPGYQGQNGKLFTLTFSARKEGIATIIFSDGAILANDGLGSNIIDSLPSLTIEVKPALVDTIPRSPIAQIENFGAPGKIVALPVITEYSEIVDDKGRAFVKGKGEPNALTKIVFNDTSLKSLGEQFINALQTKKNKPTEALVKNDKDGLFQYLSANNLVAGAYNVTPYLVDEDKQTQKPGFGVRLLVNNSKLVKLLVVFINILALLIPIVCLGVIIYFIPWYSRLRMRLLGHKMQLEDERLNLTEKEIKQKEALIEKT